jgi:D-methionine transport system permease protein
VHTVLVGTSIGTWAAIVPLITGGVPYAARLSEAAMLDVDLELVQAIKAMGATRLRSCARSICRKLFPGSSVPSPF